MSICELSLYSTMQKEEDEGGEYHDSTEHYNVELGNSAPGG